MTPRKAIVLSAAVMTLSSALVYAQNSPSGTSSSSSMQQQGSSLNSSSSAQPAGSSLSSSSSDTGTSSTSGQNAGQGTMSSSSDISAQPAGAMQGQLTSQDFVNQAASAGLFEVKSAKLAASKIDDPQIKQFATQMEKDHAKANDELKDIAKKKNLTVPSDLQGQDQQMYSQLQNQSGQQLSQLYVQDQVKAHQKTVDLFQRASSQLQDPDLKQFATKQLQILKQHQQHIQSLPGASSAGASGLSGSSSMDSSAQPAGSSSTGASGSTPGNAGPGTSASGTAGSSSPDTAR